MPSDPDVRDDNGQFAQGHPPLVGGGRPRGVAALATISSNAIRIKEELIEAVDAAHSRDEMIDIVRKFAEKNPEGYCKFIASLVPAEQPIKREDMRPSLIVHIVEDKQDGVKMVESKIVDEPKNGSVDDG